MLKIYAIPWRFKSDINGNVAKVGVISSKNAKKIRIATIEII